MLVKKNFDYYLIDKEEITDYIGREPTFIHQVLRVPFHGSLKLADFFVSQLYPKSIFQEAAVVPMAEEITENTTEKPESEDLKEGSKSGKSKKESGQNDKSKKISEKLNLIKGGVKEDFIEVNDGLVIHKDTKNDFLIFKWIASEKNDIIADCLALMFSQFPADKTYDIFYEENRTGESDQSKELRQKITKRVLGLFDKATFAINGKELNFDLKDEGGSKLIINLETGELKANKESLRGRFETMIGYMLKKVRSNKQKSNNPHPYFSKGNGNFDKGSKGNKPFSKGFGNKMGGQNYGYGNYGSMN